MSPGSRPRGPRAAPKPKPFPWTPVIVGGVLVAGLVGYFALRTDTSSDQETSVKRDPLAGLPPQVRDPKAVLRSDQDTFGHLEPGETKVMHIEADRDLIAVLDVFPSSAPVQIATLRVKSIHLTPEEEAALARSYREIKPKVAGQVHQTAQAGDVLECFVKNPGSQAIGLRIRLRWWSLGEPPPPPARNPNDDFTKSETIPPGKGYDILFPAEKSAEWSVEITAKSGTVKAGMMAVRNTPPGDEEMDRMLQSLTTVPAPHTETYKRAARIGTTLWFTVINPGSIPAIVELRSRTKPLER